MQTLRSYSLFWAMLVLGLFLVGIGVSLSFYTVTKGLLKDSRITKVIELQEEKNEKLAEVLKLEKGLSTQLSTKDSLLKDVPLVERQFQELQEAFEALTEADKNNDQAFNLLRFQNPQTISIWFFVIQLLLIFSGWSLFLYSLYKFSSLSRTHTAQDLDLSRKRSEDQLYLMNLYINSRYMSSDRLSAFQKDLIKNLENEGVSQLDFIKDQFTTLKASHYHKIKKEDLDDFLSLASTDLYEKLEKRVAALEAKHRFLPKRLNHES